MKQEGHENIDGKRKSAACWMDILSIVSAYVRAMVLNYHDSQDIIQNIAVVFAEKYADLDPSRDVVPWVLTIARYEIANYFRSKGRETELMEEKLMQRMETAYHSIHGEADKIKTALHECIQKLNKRSRHVLELRYFRDMSASDISKRLSISANAVYLILCRTRDALAKCVQRKTRLTWKIS
jgi:RNA polymerase sigma-70 factor (ECF subfamily)